MARTAGVVVIGGGIIGSATAYFLATRSAGKLPIVVLEPDPTYALASTPKATGVVRHQYGVPENVRMSLYGSEFYAAAPQLLAVDGVEPDFGFRERGYVWLVRPEHLDTVREMMDVQHACGAEVELLDPAALARWLPDYDVTGLAAGFRGGKGAGWLDPWGALQAIRRKAVSLGVEYIADRAVRLRRDGRRILSVTTAGGLEIASDQFVDAAGALGAAAVSAMAGLPLPVEPRRRSVFIVSCRRDVRHFPMTVHPSDGVWFRPEGPNLLCGVAPKVGDAATNDQETIDHEQFEATIWPTMASLVPAFEALKVAGTYAGLYDFNSLDENAILGPPAELDNFHYATGFSGHGVMQAPAAGRAVAELILDGHFTTLDLTRFGYGRIAADAPLPEPACF